ncbi:MAG TPA: hypothetical protein VNK49_00010 [Anaerolineales bacterium]|nr:hypothetical protein [Anaerolineales bacterium]
MTSRIHQTLLLTLSLLFSTLACRAATNLILPPTPPPTLTQTATPTPLPPTSTPTPIVQSACPLLLENIMDAATKENAYRTAESNKKTAREQRNRFLVIYSISNDTLSTPLYKRVPESLKDEREDRKSHEAIWNYFATLVPYQARKSVTEFAIMTDGQENILAGVLQSNENPAEWTLAIDILDAKDNHLLTYVFMHELGHLITLNADQVPPSERIFENPGDEEIYAQEASACHQYFPGEGCSQPESYINAFYNRFWRDLYNEWLEIDKQKDENEDEYQNMLDDFYRTYQDQFLTDYAVTSPEEDIAEAWAFFVLSSLPQTYSIAQEKILFFYEYPELIELRQELLSRLCEAFPTKDNETHLSPSP